VLGIEKRPVDVFRARFDALSAAVPQKIRSLDFARDDIALFFPLPKKVLNVHNLNTVLYYTDNDLKVRQVRFPLTYTNTTDILPNILSFEKRRFPPPLFF